MPLGTSGCAYVFAFEGGILHSWTGGLGVKRVGEKKSEGGSLLSSGSSTLLVGGGGDPMSDCLPGNGVSYQWGTIAVKRDGETKKLKPKSPQSGYLRLSAGVGAITPPFGHSMCDIGCLTSRKIIILADCR